METRTSTRKLEDPSPHDTTCKKREPVATSANSPSLLVTEVDAHRATDHNSGATKVRLMNHWFAGLYCTTARRQGGQEATLLLLHHNRSRKSRNQRFFPLADDCFRTTGFRSSETTIPCSPLFRTVNEVNSQRASTSSKGTYDSYDQQWTRCHHHPHHQRRQKSPQFSP